MKTRLKIIGIPALLCCTLLCGMGAAQAESVMRVAQASDDLQSRLPIWKTMSDVNLSMGFAEGWDTHEQKDAIVGVSPDGKVRIQAYVSEFPSVKETLDNLQRTFNSFCENLNLTDPQLDREVNGLKVLSTGGSAKHKDSDEMIDVSVDLVEVNAKVVVLVIYGTHESMEKNSDDCILSQWSFKSEN